MELPTANSIDVQVGLAIKARRRMLGLSQAALAEEIGLTFQQVQKYERGTNRVSASVLYAIALALGCPVGVFFEALPTAGVAGENGLTGEARDFMAAQGGAELARIYLSLPPEYRKALRMSAKAFVDSLLVANPR